MTNYPGNKKFHTNLHPQFKGYGSYNLKSRISPKTAIQKYGLGEKSRFGNYDVSQPL